VRSCWGRFPQGLQAPAPGHGADRSPVLPHCFWSPRCTPTATSSPVPSGRDSFHCFLQRDQSPELQVRKRGYRACAPNRLSRRLPLKAGRCSQPAFRTQVQLVKNTQASRTSTTRSFHHVDHRSRRVSPASLGATQGRFADTHASAQQPLRVSPETLCGHQLTRARTNACQRSDNSPT